MIPYGRQEITAADIEAVVKVLRSDFLTQGPVVPRFEESVARYSGASHAVAVNSATSALHIACLALDLGPGDRLWTSPNTFVASANCALYCGAQVDFVDIDPVHYNMSVEALRTQLEQAERAGRLPKIVVPVHFAGHPCNMPAIHALSEHYGFKIIEDASHAIGADYMVSQDEQASSRGAAETIKVGSCTHSDITVFSFHPVKIITTGEGGMALTRDPEIAERLRRLRTHGITSDRARMQPRPEDEIWNYQQIELGFNYRMTDLQAALGLSQMDRLDEYIRRRHIVAQRYDTELANLNIILPRQSPNAHSSYHLYPIRIRNTPGNRLQQQVYQGLRQAGIAVNLHYIPVHRQPYYEAMGFRPGNYPVAEQFHREAISLPIFPALGNAQEQVIRTLRSMVTSELPDKKRSLVGACS